MLVMYENSNWVSVVFIALKIHSHYVPLLGSKSQEDWLQNRHHGIYSVIQYIRFGSHCFLKGFCTTLFHINDRCLYSLSGSCAVTLIKVKIFKDIARLWLLPRISISWNISNACR